VSHVQAGHEHAARRRAHGAARVELREAHALGGELVEVRRLNQLLPVAAEFPIAEIVGEDEDDVWFGRLRAGRGDQREDEKKRGEEAHERTGANSTVPFNPARMRHVD
jgi:hypothetical protein